MITIPTPTVSTSACGLIKDKMIASETADDDNDTDTTVSSSINSVSPVSSIDKQLSSSCSTNSGINNNKDQQSPRRRSIFDTYWEKSNSSSVSIVKKDNDSCNDVSSPPGRRNSSQQAAKLQPSYLGIYKFASHSPLISPNPATLSPISIGSPDCIVLAPSSDSSHPKSILRRHKSFHKHISDHDEVGNTLDIAPPPFSNVSKSSSSRRSIFGDIVSKSECMKRHPSVNFDPTITVRECLGDGSFNSQESWYQEDELQTFMTETINVCVSYDIC